MAYSFATRWTDEIANISSNPEYQTAEVTITFAVSDGEYDIETGQGGDRVIETLYTGQARVIAIRTSVFRQAAAQMNSHVSEFVRVQIPKNATGRVLTGAVVTINAAPDTPSLEGRRLMVNSDFHGASSATRTLECGYDNDQRTT